MPVEDSLDMGSSLRLNVSQYDRETESLSYNGITWMALQPPAFLLTAGGISWLIGRALGNPKAARDTIFLVALTAFFCCHALSQVAREMLRVVSEAWMYLIPLLAVNGLQLVYLYSRPAESPATTEQNTATPLKPLILPASTSHTRLFPRHHSFKYSYLLVGAPVGAPGNVGNLLSWDVTGPSRWWRNAWFSVHAEDYLLYTHPTISNKSRASGKTAKSPPLREKLNAYLKSEGIGPSTYPHAYLVTAPRVLGFSFNPVSFWYLYDDSMVLKAMILEVNNTFGERRMYFMQDTDDDVDAIEDGSKDAVEEEKGTKRFKSKWDKDFHVSPFNDREGVYSLTAIDPVASSKSPSTLDKTEVMINNIITLSSPIYNTPHPPPESGTSSSSDASAIFPAFHPKIIASVSSSTKPVNPSTLSLTQKYVFLLSWAPIVFLTDPRILAEARLLWSKGLKVWFRPEVHFTTLGRVETAEEALVEGAFRVWLQAICRHGHSSDSTVDGATKSGVRVWYTPAAGPSRGQAIAITDSPREDESGSSHLETIEVNIKVLTPAFYSELIISPSLREVWEKRCFNPVEGEAMATCSDPGRLRKIIGEWMTETVGKQQAFEKDKGKMDITKSFMARLSDNLRHGRYLIGALFSAVFEPVYLCLRGHNSAKRTPLLSPASFVDNIHILSFPPPDNDKLHYFNHASHLILLAHRLALGSTSLLRFYGSVVRYMLLYVVAREISGFHLGSLHGGGLLEGLVVETETRMDLALDLGSVLRLLSRSATILIMSLLVSSVGRFFSFS